MQSCASVGQVGIMPFLDVLFVDGLILAVLINFGTKIDIHMRLVVFTINIPA